MGFERWPLSAQLLTLVRAPQRPGFPLVPSPPLPGTQERPRGGNRGPVLQAPSRVELNRPGGTVGLRHPYPPHRRGNRGSERWRHLYQVRAGPDLNPGWLWVLKVSPVLGARLPTGARHGSPGQCWLWDEDPTEGQALDGCAWPEVPFTYTALTVPL